jgi:histidinol-phosphatase (PHP family)
MYPHPALLRELHDRGVPITVSSDAHRPNECGAERDKAIALAQSVGYTTRVTFDRRARKEVPLDGV